MSMLQMQRLMLRQCVSPLAKTPQGPVSFLGQSLKQSIRPCQTTITRHLSLALRNPQVLSLGNKIGKFNFFKKFTTSSFKSGYHNAIFAVTPFLSFFLFKKMSTTKCESVLETSTIDRQLDTIKENAKVQKSAIMSRIKSISQFFVVSFYMIRRVLWVCILSIPVCGLVPIAVLHHKLSSQQNTEGFELADWWWRMVVRCLEMSGPTLVKFGQWASTRRDLFSTQFCSHLSMLHSQRKPHSYRHTASVICHSFNLQNIDEIFDELEKTPVGSGCVAQVHKAKLKGSSKWIAVKVLHPRVRQHVESDLRLMAAGAKLLSLIPGSQWFGLVDTVDQFSGSMRMQLDLEIEAENLNKFDKNFKNNPLINFPVPIMKYVTKNVLMESFEEGVGISHYIHDKYKNSDHAALTKQEQKDAKKMAQLGLKSFMKMVLIHNFVHADLHPGNILVRQTDHGPGLTFLDAGIAIELDKKDQENFCDLLNGIVYNEGKYVGKIMVERSRQHNCTDVESFSNEIGDLVSEVHSSKLSLSKVKIGDILSKVFHLVREHQIRIETNFATLMLAIVVMEGLGRSLDSDLDILKTCIPILTEAKIKGKF